MIELPPNFSFRELTAQDLPDVLNLIKRHNHDDYECAAQSYAKSLNGQFVLLQQGAVAGVTGARKIPGTDRSFWLSWTYLDPNAAMQMDTPTLMFDLICDKLRERANARKLFAMISPGVDSGLGGGHSYGGSLNSYTDFGFQNELSHRDYYDAGETGSVLSLRLQNKTQENRFPAELRHVGILDSDEIPETDDAYYVEWDFFDGPISPDQSVRHWIQEVQKWEGRVIFIGIPGNAESAIHQLLGEGFTRDGQLTDFYEDGLDEVRLRYDL